MHQKNIWSKYSDFYRNSLYATFPQEHRVSQGTLSARMILVEQSEHNFDDPSVSETIIALPLSTSENSEWSWNMGDGWIKETSRPGHMLLLPPDQTSKWRVTGKRTLLLLAIPSETIQKVLRTSIDHSILSALTPLSNRCWQDEFLNHSMQQLWKYSKLRHPLNTQISDGILTTVISHLIMASGSEDLNEKTISFPSWRLNKLLDFVSANIASDIDIATMAKATGLSSRHFSRAFADQTGQTPHRWLMERRSEKAKHMLRGQEVDLSSIARDCGFSDQSHFCRVFKEITGETPRRWHMKNFN